LHDPINERAVFEQAEEFLTKEFGVPIRMTHAESSKHAKAQTALPFKPAIIIE
jgi:leucyl-tRNA synthetase